jgi:DNA adenine methylase
LAPLAKKRCAAIHVTSRMIAEPENCAFANVRPFLRWAGSKRKLLKYLVPLIPRRWNKYYEPFLGGGAMFFLLCPPTAEVSDASTSLIDTYKAVRDNPNGVLNFLRPLRPNRSTFEKIKRLNAPTVSQAAGRFIFLNKACWNGLYRVNSEGIFNVPYGWPKTNFVIDEENLRKCATQLRRRSVSLRCQDFETIADRVVKRDFVFLDPPYVTSHNMNGFIDWNESLFSWKDQIRLASLAKDLVARGANVLITNADHDDVHRLYGGFARRRIVRHSTLASDKSRRRLTSEVVFFAGPAYDQLTAFHFRGGHPYGGDRRAY